MIQSCLFDSVEVPSSGYINEVNSRKLDEADQVKFKGRKSSQALVPKSEPPCEGLKWTSSRSATAAAATESPLGDPGAGPSADQTWGTFNGVGPAPVPQPAGDAGGLQDDRDSCTSTENGVHPSQPFLEGQDMERQHSGSLAWDASPGILNRDSSAPALGERGLQLPDPDYPAPEPAAVRREQDSLFPGPSEDGRLQPPIHRASAERSVDPGTVCPQTRRESFNDALSMDGLNLCWKGRDPAPPEVTLVNWGSGWTEKCPGAPEFEDAAVAEALAALDAATAGEDVDV